MSVKWLAVPMCMLLGSVYAFAESYSVNSPNSRISVTVSNDQDGLSYAVTLDDKPLLSDSSLGLLLDNQELGRSTMKVLDYSSNRVDGTVEFLAGRAKVVRDHYNAAKFLFEATSERRVKIGLEVRAYDEGVAFRYLLPAKQGKHIQGERTLFGFADDFLCYGLNLGKFVNGHEGEFDPVRASKIREHNLYDAPLVCKTGDKETTIALAESNVRDYAGAWFTGRGDGDLGVAVRLTPYFGSMPGEPESKAVVINPELAELKTPWRVVMVGDTPGRLVESNLIPLLGEPNQIGDTSWIKPGKVAWDWWNNNQVAVDNPGMNTQTYKAYIDFAAALGLEYILIDAGWHEGSSWKNQPGANVVKPIAEMDLPAILAYGKARNVGVWVWLQWKQLDWQMEEALSMYEKWDIKGIKVDFMERSDQDMIDYYHTLLSTAAKYHLMVNLHGVIPPNGLIRTYPNLLTQEGVMGAEYNKWSARISATHNVTLPFTRMILGPIDYTPGGFRHATPQAFPQLRRYTLPYVQTTRGQAIAMYVVYDSPLQMLADSPLTYTRQDGTWEEGLTLIQSMPVSWDETRVLSGDIGEYIVSARRSGNIWYVGAMTNEKSRKLKINLDFLPSGVYTVERWQDGADISTLKYAALKLKNTQSVKLELAQNGGAVLKIKQDF